METYSTRNSSSSYPQYVASGHARLALAQTRKYRVHRAGRHSTCIDTAAARKKGTAAHAAHGCVRFVVKGGTLYEDEDGGRHFS